MTHDTGISLFSGIGGLDRAFERAGGTVILQCEQDAWCRQVLAHHWPHVPCHDDVKTLKVEEFVHEPIDVVFGGIPCQPFSLAGGKRKGMADDRYLWPETFSLLTKILPTCLVIEEVAQFLNVAFPQVASDLESEGYEVGAYLLPACSVGAPHKRGTRTMSIA